MKKSKWIKWDGGAEYPPNLPLDAKVDVKFRDNAVDDEGTLVAHYFWEHDMLDSDIVAYRVHKEKSTKQKKSKWVDWNGDTTYPPGVDADTLVDFRCRGGAKGTNIRAGDCYWDHKGYQADIVAYKICKKAKACIISLLSGGFFDYNNPDESDYTIGDVANNLSRICRFTGALNCHLSVAQHSLYTSYLVPPEHALSALMHDAPEFVLGDVNSPLKSMLKKYQKLEHKVATSMAQQFGFTYPFDISVEKADKLMFEVEDRVFREGMEESILCGDVPKKVKPWSAKKAKRKFLERYMELKELNSTGEGV